MSPPTRARTDRTTGAAPSTARPITQPRPDGPRDDAEAMRTAVSVHVVALVIATGWYLLQRLHITLDAPPPLPPGDRIAKLSVFFDYMHDELAQRWGATLISSVSFAALVVFAPSLRRLAGRRNPTTLIQAGATIYLIAQLIQAGTYRYILNAPPATDRETMLALLDLADTIDDTIETLAYLLLAAGITDLTAALHARPGTTVTSTVSIITAATYTALAIATTTAPAVLDPLLLTGGLIVGPAWAIAVTTQITRLDPLA